MQATIAPEGYATPITFTAVSVPTPGGRPWEYTRTDLVKGDLDRVGSGKVDWEVAHDPTEGGSVFLTRLTGKASPFTSNKTVRSYEVDMLVRTFSICAYQLANPALREVGTTEATVTVAFPAAIEGKRQGFPPTSLHFLRFEGVDGHLTGVVRIGEHELVFSNLDRRASTALVYMTDGENPSWQPRDLASLLPEGVDVAAYEAHLAAAVDAVEDAANTARNSLLSVIGDRLAAAAL